MCSKTLKKANQKKTFYVWDEAPFHKLSPTRYRELREFLNKPNGPSIHITTAELADVVNGRDDIPLPDWATDHKFETELESLIDNNSVVWICWDCDSLISFFDDPKMGKFITRELSLVQQSERVPCPFCGSLKLAFYNPKVLATGEKVNPIDWDESVNNFKEPADIKKSLESQKLSSNEIFLDKILRSEYDIPPTQRSDLLYTSEYTLDKLSKEYSTMVSSWKQSSGLPKHNPDAFRNLKSPLSLRTNNPDGISNILSQNWNRVIEIIACDYPEFSDIAVGMAVSPGFSASAHMGDNGEIALIIEFGLFAKQVRLNHLLSLLFDTDMLLKPQKGLDWTIDEIVANIISELTEKPLEERNVRIIPKLNYSSQEEFLRAHIITEAQMVFAILHELGHVADWKTSPELIHHKIKDPFQRTCAIETWADTWAMNLIFKRGEEFYLPWIQYQSILWLFEYWNLMNIKHQSYNTYFNSRSRWDHIESMIQKCKKGKNLDELYIDELRHIFDTAINEWRKQNGHD